MPFDRGAIQAPVLVEHIAGSGADFGAVQLDRTACLATHLENARLPEQNAGSQDTDPGPRPMQRVTLRRDDDGAAIDAAPLLALVPVAEAFAIGEAQPDVPTKCRVPPQPRVG